jgi:hypothetical protein
MAGATTGTVMELLTQRYPKKRSGADLAPRTRSYDLAPGLSRREAMRQATRRDGYDFRGFTYDPRSGRARMI